MSPRIACDNAISPPAPMPWTARNAINWAMSWAKPQAREASRKIPMADWNMIFRP